MSSGGSDGEASASTSVAREHVARQRRKASADAMSKIKWHTTGGTRKAKEARARSESMKRSTGKLLSTSERLVQEGMSLDANTDAVAPTGNVVGDFSSHDLIRNRVAEPSVFDDPPQGPSSNELIHVPATLPPSSANERPSSWSSILNPFSYYGQRAENPEKEVDPESTTKKPERATGRVESVDDEILSNPQGSSTPN